MKVQVKDLRVGDVLLPTHRTVTSAPYRCAKCRAGEVNIGIDGYARRWRAATQISVAMPRPELSPREIG